MFNELILGMSIALAPITIKPKVELVPIKLELSAFCPCYECSEGWGYKTASGETLREGFIALPKEIPFNTILDVPNERRYINKDRGGYIKKVGNVYRVDVFMESHKDTIKYGRKRSYGYIVKGANND